ncbi:hypothetical protein [Paraburkholderia sp. J8-2]|uniref:hypothetical protein n=1 Tax=Paraburkholderia sp. J8-2 TaxID=2805440 RepID=UPI002AB7F235|nr:hypothetical protein [Paraburkholderia sp. J8-2]
MNALVPHRKRETPVQPSKAERIFSWAVTVTLGLAGALEAIGAVPAHALRDVLRGTGMWWLEVGGEAIDSVFAFIHSSAIEAAPEIGKWGTELPKEIALGMYYAAMSLLFISFVAAVWLAMGRERQNLLREIGGGTSSWGSEKRP